MMTKLVNLTPHAIRLQLPDGTALDIQPSGQVARVATQARDAGQLDGIPVVQQTYGDVQGLPDPQDGVAYLVSGLVLSAVKAAGGRSDVYAPDTSPDSAVRDNGGRIVAVRRLVQAL